MSQEQTSVPTCCHKHQQLGYDDGGLCLGAPRSSLDMWKEEFYPTSGKEAADQGLEAALLHGIQKWKGLLPENLGLFPNLAWDYKYASLKEFQNGRLSAEFGFGRETCALCQMFIMKADVDGEKPCSGCPLYYESSESACYDEERAYGLIIDVGGSPLLMVKELEAALSVWREKNYGIGQPAKAEE